MTGKRTAHEKALEKIALNADVLDIPHVVSVTQEKKLFHKGRIIAEPDIIFECSTGEVYIIEYKGNGNGELLRRAQRQLEMAVYWYGKYQNLDPDKIHTMIISGDDPRYRDLFK